MMDWLEIFNEQLILSLLITLDHLLTNRVNINDIMPLLNIIISLNWINFYTCFMYTISICVMIIIYVFRCCR